MSRRRRGQSAEGATDIAFLMLFLLMFSLVNVEEGTPDPVRLMDTAPLFRVAEAAASPDTTQDLLRIRLFPGGFPKGDPQLPASVGQCVPARADEIAGQVPGLVELVWDRPERSAGGIVCRVSVEQWQKIEDGNLDILSGPLAEALVRAGARVSETRAPRNWRRVALEINRSTAFEFVHQAGEGIRSAAATLRGQGRLSGTVEVYYVGRPSGLAPAQVAR